MIHVAFPEPGKHALVDAALAAIARSDEPNRITGHFERGDPAKRPAFRLYKHANVVAALASLFDERCSYCESDFRHVTTPDIEHYRPKSEVLEEDGTTVGGYYWLASDLKNLLYSCPDCNRERYQWEVQPDGTREKKLLGKGTKFPLAADTERAHAPENVANEEPLLLHPFFDQPRRHLRFKSTGIVLPAHTAEEKAAPRGDKTIEVCALNRSGLKGARESFAKRLVGHIKRECRAKVRVRKNPTDQDHQNTLQEAQEERVELLQGRESYSALKEEVNGAFEQLISLVDRYWAEETAHLTQPTANTLPALAATILDMKKKCRDPVHGELVTRILSWLGIDVPAHTL